MSDYWTLRSLADLYLEDSWVLNILVQPGVVILDMELVLRESHPGYQEPRAGEMYCYRRGQLRFGQVAELIWRDQGAPPARDATGEPDYGSIDDFEVADNRFRLAGDFGRIEIVSAPPYVDLER